MGFRSEMEQFNKKKQDELLQFNQALNYLEGKIELCISLDECAMEDALEDELEFEEEEQEREEREEIVKKQQQIQLNQPRNNANEISPEHKFFMQVSASSLELFSSIFNSFAQNYSHMDYEDHELGCDLNEEKSEVNLRFPTAHIARTFLDLIAQSYPQLVLFMVPGNKKSKEQEELESPSYSRMRERMLNPFNTKFTRD